MLLRAQIAAWFVALSLLSTLPAQEQPKPGPEQEQLKQLEGKWKFKLTTPDGAETQGTSVYKMECGGLWLTSDFQTDFGGVKFQGKGLDGYDARKKKYVSVWVDSMTTYPMTFEGDYDNAEKKLTMVSDSVGPDGKPAQWRSVTTMTSKDEHQFEMFMKPEGGQEAKVMTVVYKREK